ncbi:hypothetical protein BB8028_0003g15910 [Beauveria bassiana]|uniref:Uncharacterized protein n=1 Tax=Beauveria bassiana TaxID=176275 RepID=A0A2S7Y9Z4_BEABA|nr:hypothetical protein BB8028_0003g15910 [Beauveria bassiana]
MRTLKDYNLSNTKRAETSSTSIRTGKKPTFTTTSTNTVHQEPVDAWFAIAEGSKGLLVKPFRGNGIFWNNIYSNGSGDARVIHAGLPPESGVKIGLNIWSTYFFDAPFIGG